MTRFINLMFTTDVLVCKNLCPLKGYNARKFVICLQRLEKRGLNNLLKKLTLAT